MYRVRSEYYKLFLLSYNFEIIVTLENISHGFYMTVWDNLVGLDRTIGLKSMKLLQKLIQTQNSFISSQSGLVKPKPIWDRC